jgi:hypothetical protein
LIDVAGFESRISGGGDQAQGQGARVRQGHLDALHLADPAHSLLRHPAKRGKIDASVVTRSGNTNVAEIHPPRPLMMLAHEIFDPETNKRVLVDHAFIVAGGELTKAPRNAIGNALNASRRNQIMFMDRNDILNLYVVTNLPLPAGALPASPVDLWTVPADEPPF